MKKMILRRSSGTVLRRSSGTVLMTKLVFILVFATMFLATFLACKKEQPDFNKEAKDPCACASEVSADFVIEERATHIPQEIWVETDTTLHSKNVRFRALEEDAEYTWYIGMDIETDQAPFKYFSDDWVGYDIPITLVVKKEPNNTCFPDDDGYDSITKTFHVSPYPIYHGFDDNIEHGGIEGTYLVFGDNLTDSIEVTINVRDFFGVRTVDIGNPDGSGINCEITNGAKKINHWTYRHISTKSYTDPDLCISVGVEILNQMDGKSVLDFVAQKPNSQGVYETTTWQYKGRKIN